MTIQNKVCKVFDPINISVAVTSSRFMLDTWHSKGLMLSSFFDKLTGVSPVGKTSVMLSGGMSIERPLVKVGIQIGNIKALPVEFALIDDGVTPVLFGSDFLELVFDIQAKGIAESDQDFDETLVSIDSPAKYDPNSLGIRLIPENQSIDALQLERFLRSVREVHNICLIACDHLHQHGDWPEESTQSKVAAVRSTIKSDEGLYDSNTLRISWVENGSIWLSLKSGSKSALSWLSQIFEKSTDARLRKTIAEAASAEEDATIKQLTRDEIARAKAWEQRNNAAKHIKATRKQWHETVLGEIDFRAKLAEKIVDPDIRAEAEKQMDKAISDLVSSNFLPVIENIPAIEPSERDTLRTKQLPGGKNRRNKQ